MRHLGLRGRALALGAALVAVATFGVLGVSGVAVAASAPTVTVSGARIDPPDPALALAVARWVKGGGQADLTALGTDFSALEDAANANDLPQMSASCQQLHSDVEQAQKYKPIPDQKAQTFWANALAQYARGATDCIAGADGSNATLMTKASTEITAGSAQLDKVTARLAEIAG
jgi:hypothetical protein